MKQISTIILLLTLSISTCYSSYLPTTIPGDVTRTNTTTTDTYSRSFNVTLKSTIGQIVGNTAAGETFDQLNFYFNASNLNVYYDYAIYKSSSPSRYYIGGLYNFNYRPSCIVEYLETNGKPGYQYLQDQVVGWLRLDVGYKFSVLRQSVGSVGVFNYTISPNSQYPANVFSMNMYLSSSAIDVNSVPMASAQSMLSMTISNYYSLTNNRKSSSICDTPADCVSTGPSGYSQSRLAIVSVIYSSTNDFGTDLGKAKMMLTTSEKNLLIGGTWSKQASTQYNTIYSGDTVNVYTSANNTVNGNMFVFEKFGSLSQLLIHSFDTVRPSYLAWNGPIVGVVQDSHDNGSFKVVIPTFLIIVLILCNLL
ncbi:hypothetical protein CYY_004403 [Polysphondylium violaceum]|uniref:Uncharacterized protein n=1 Tax=Polysphondylium violaceum TaxID=133409 RepID=A0A8J4PW87_9MYCE|nr:hypothetical protein CYY_004403 [Polysphondylium violaceum]